MDAQQKQLKHQSEELKRKREEFETATENMSEGLIILNEKGVILSLNRAAAKMLGLSEDSVGKDIFSEKTSVDLKEPTQTALSGNRRVIRPQCRSHRRQQRACSFWKKYGRSFCAERRKLSVARKPRFDRRKSDGSRIACA